MNPLPSYDELHRRFRYEPSTGWLIHKQIPRGGSRNKKIAGSPSGKGHLLVGIGGARYWVHRVVWKMMTGQEPEHLDHINGDGCDNRMENLRPATHAENNRNRGGWKRTRTSSRYKGVCYDRATNKWCAEITTDYKKKFLGRFDSEEDAARAYNAAAEELHGEYARLNEVGEGSVGAGEGKG